MAEKQDLSQSIRLLLALSALAATNDTSSRSNQSKKWYKDHTSQWLRSICKLVQIPHASLPPSISSTAVRESASDQLSAWSTQDQERMANVLVEASLAGDPDVDDKIKAKEENALKYTPLAKGLNHKALEYLGLDAGRLLGDAERSLAGTLFKALKAAQEGSSAKVEESRQKQAQGWGGSLGRKLATGAGVVAGGVLIGVTGGLAAPAIAALLAPLGIGGLLAGGAAPVVLGTLFGVGGGGLAGRRVRERWRGVEEFGFVEIGAGTKATTDEIEDLKQARERYQARKKKGEDEAKAETETETEKADKDLGKDVKEGGEEDKEKTDDEVSAEVEKDRLKLEEKLLSLSLNSITAEPESPRQSLDSAPTEKDIAKTNKPPSLTATIVVPGLLTVSQTEGVTAWRAICAPGSEGVIPAITPEEGKGVVEEGKLDAWKDGRDVYLLRFETATMLKSGRDIDHWVTGKLKKKLKGEIIKRTVLSAYFAAVSLPMTAYSLASMGLDNTWMQAQDRAKKAGRLLGEVLEKKVQGERPVILIGTSLGALTILTALQYLAALPGGDVPDYVESVYLISLPAAPTPEEWANVRKVVARRVVNAYSESDWVLAGVVRLHEVVTRAATLSSGIKVAGLGPVAQPEVEDVDISSVLKGHMELQTKLSDILKIINVDE